MWWYGEGAPNGWTYALMTVSMILFWGLIIYGVVWLVRYGGRDDVSEAQKPTPQDLLAERFARGEIDEQEYRQRLETLRHQRLPTAQL